MYGGKQSAIYHWYFVNNDILYIGPYVCYWIGFIYGCMFVYWQSQHRMDCCSIY